MTSSSKLGLKVVIDGVEKDLDDIFLKITDYNANPSNYQAGEAVQLMQNTGIKYIENGVKKDLIDRYIGYDSSGYNADNYEADPSRVNVSDLNKIKITNDNNLVNLFYQLGTKKKNITLNNIYIISMHNKSIKLDFHLSFHDDVLFRVYANYDSNVIELSYKLNSTLTSWSQLYRITNTNVLNTAITSPNLEISNFTQSSKSRNKIVFYLNRINNESIQYLNIISGSKTKFFDKDTD